MPSDSRTVAAKDLSARGIFAFWAPLAATWVMMAVEGPYLAAVVARLPEPTLGLAAYGVAIAMAVLIEAPVIMLLSASTALVEDAVSYRRLRTFAHGLNAFSTLLLLLVLVPPVHRGLMIGALGLPEDLAHLTYGALWCFLPWPAAIGYRRFWQGVLIRSGRTRLVAGGTVLRLIAMSTAAIVLAVSTDLPGASVGASALSSAWSPKRSWPAGWPGARSVPCSARPTGRRARSTPRRSRPTRTTSRRSGGWASRRRTRPPGRPRERSFASRTSGASTCPSRSPRSSGSAFSPC